MQYFIKQLVDKKTKTIKFLRFIAFTREDLEIKIYGYENIE